MKRLTPYDKQLRVTAIKVAMVVTIIAALFFPSYVKFEKTGDNIFTVFMNGEQVGTVAAMDEIEEYVQEARSRIASEQKELILIDAQTTVEGREVIWGKIDDEEEIRSRILQVLQKNIKQTMHRSYMVKINDYTVSLASTDEVIQLLQASVDKYDAEEQYAVELKSDPAREFNVLTADVVCVADRKEEEAVEAANAILPEGGIIAELTRMIESVEPAREKEFEDYELGLQDMRFSDEVEVVECYLPIEELTPLEEAIEQVTKDQEKNKIYEVVSGDTLSQIAINNNLTMEKLIAMNGALENENSTIRVGDELIITIPEPELSVEREEELYMEEEYDADVIYVDNDNWYITETKTLQEPSAGFRKLIARVSFRNSEEVGREIIKEEVVMEAVPKIVERGTKIPPTYIKPISGGRQTSGFGRRKSPRRGASSYHKGVDWAVPTGTAVMASSSGTVAKAGWGSGYGYVIYINHADGRQTRYGHLSKVLVSAGQTVKQGEKIALSGNTGISTGPHVHFEMLIGGSQVNPLNYLN